jgi:hypothetical protein
VRRAAPLAAAALLALALPASPALAGAADPARSHASAHAPALAPGVWGAAPVHGTLAGDGSIHLWAPVDGIQTGNTLYDALLRRFLGPALALHTGPLAPATARPRRVRVDAVVSAGVAVAELPLTLRVRAVAGGTSLSTYFSVPLAPYGVIHPLGHDPGRVQVAVYAFFPTR